MTLQIQYEVLLLVIHWMAHLTLVTIDPRRTRYNWRSRMLVALTYELSFQTFSGSVCARHLMGRRECYLLVPGT